MATYFRFTEDGKILLAKTLFNKGITEKEFMEKAREIDFETLLEYCPLEQMDQYGIRLVSTASNLQTEMELYRLYKPNLSRIGPVILYSPAEGYYCSGCFVGDKFFDNAYVDKKIMKEAIEYGVKFYGEDFMKEIMDKGYLSEPNRQEIISELDSDIPTPYIKVHFFTRKKETTKEGYDSLLKREKEFTRIRSTACPLHDDNSVTMVTPKKIKNRR